MRCSRLPHERGEGLGIRLGARDKAKGLELYIGLGIRPGDRDKARGMGVTIIICT